MEISLKKLTAQEKKYSVELEMAIAEYRNFRAQSADVDHVELYYARETIHPEYKRYAEVQGEEPTMNDVDDALYDVSQNTSAV